LLSQRGAWSSGGRRPSVSQWGPGPAGSGPNIGFADVGTVGSSKNVREIRAGGERIGVFRRILPFCGTRAVRGDDTIRWYACGARPTTQFGD
jgi:hypothetical protein